MERALMNEESTPPLHTPLTAGVDEAGRGPIAGPVVAAAAILLPHQANVLLSEGLNDSKKLTAKARERLFARIMELGVECSAKAASHRMIDRVNILRATLWAMRHAVLMLPSVPDILIVDGNFCIPELPGYNQRAIPKADATEPAVMAASVIAKVLRDRAMDKLHKEYPEYGFDKHKGYPTQKHREVLDMIGPSPVHRLSFKGYNKERSNLISKESSAENETEIHGDSL